MCGIFSKIRDISFTLCYNVLKVLSMYRMFGILPLKTFYQTAVRQVSQIKERISKKWITIIPEDHAKRLQNRFSGADSLPLLHSSH